MRRKKPFKSYRLLPLIIAIGIVFTLFVLAIISHFNKYDGKTLSLFSGDYKYVFMVFLLILPFALYKFISIAFSPSDNADLATPEYFGVNFKKMEEEKDKLKAVKEPTHIDLPGYVASNQVAAPVVTEEKEDEEEIEEAPQEETIEDKVLPEGESRFYMLTNIDKTYENFIHPEFNNEITLREVCEEFRNFACQKLRLYYDIEDIRRFIGGLSVTKLIILQGMSGTGKTSLAYAFGEFLDNTTTIVPIQPMWKERTDLIGYYNEFTKRFNETTLLYKMYEANYSKEIYITVLDELNIARVEYYFAEFLSLLEIPNPDGRNLDVVADKWDNDPKLLNKGKLRLPTNMWFIGTANNDDSTFSISDKVYDRAMVLNLDKKATPFEAPETKNLKISSEYLQSLFAKAQREYDISDRNLRRLKRLDEYMIQTFHITFGNRIMKQIRSYVPVLVACGGTELEALDDILSRKVFRKLESKNPVYVKQAADGVCTYLDELFGVDKMPLCKEAIRLIEQNV